MNRPTTVTAVLAAGILSALGATICCGLPLALVLLGVSGAWVADLMSMNRFYPVFIGLVIAAFGFAFYRLYLMKPAPCTAEADCANLLSHRRQRIAFWATLVPVTALLTSRFYAQWLI